MGWRLSVPIMLHVALRASFAGWRAEVKLICLNRTGHDSGVIDVAEDESMKVAGSEKPPTGEGFHIFERSTVYCMKYLFPRVDACAEKLCTKVPECNTCEALPLCNPVVVETCTKTWVY